MYNRCNPQSTLLHYYTCSLLEHTTSSIWEVFSVFAQCICLVCSDCQCANSILHCWCPRTYDTIGVIGKSKCFALWNTQRICNIQYLSPNIRFKASIYFISHSCIEFPIHFHEKKRKTFIVDWKIKCCEFFFLCFNSYIFSAFRYRTKTVERERESEWGWEFMVVNTISKEVIHFTHLHKHHTLQWINDFLQILTYEDKQSADAFFSLLLLRFLTANSNGNCIWEKNKSW